MTSRDDKTTDTLGLADTFVDEAARSRDSTTGSDQRPPGDSWMTSMAGLLRAVAAAPSLDGAPVLTPGSLVNDTFRVDSLVAAGGMGVVYLAEDIRLGRKVALKIHLRSSNPDSKKRLMREASAMARLSHPNVLTVHEVGWIDQHLFVAMEYVDGWTLRAWLDESDRSTRDILAVMTAAGDGLAAAHAAGFVHRDFKPENVLIGRDGRVLVADFGLVRTEADEEPTTHSRAISANPLDQSLTVTGASMGTPAYMSPEQMRGDAVDARADQFSYCVALYESLFKSRPYEGRTASQLRVSLELGTPSAPDEDGGVPAHVRRAIMRGVAADPAARHSSMSALLAELRDDPSARWRKRLAVAAGLVGVVAALVAVAVVLTTRRGGDRNQLCSGGDEEIAAVWNDARRGKIAAAYRATELSYAPTTWTQASKTIDRYATEWSTAHKSACRDVRVRKTQSVDMLDRRMACLRTRLRAADSLLSVFETPDAKIVEKTLAATEALPETRACADADYVLSGQTLPANPEVAKRVRALSVRIDRARAQLDAGSNEKARAQASELVSEAQATNYEPVIADAELLLGKVQRAMGDYKAAETTLSSAYFRARKSNDERVSAEAAAMLIWAVGYDQARYKEAQQWAGHAQVELKRPGLYPITAAATYSTLGVLLEIRGDYAQALVQHRKALAVVNSLDGDKPVLRARILNHVGTTLDELGRLDEASATLTRALQLTQEAHGDTHPSVIDPLSNLGLVQTGLGQFAKAVATQRRVLAINESVHDKGHIQTGYAALNLGVALHRSGEFDEALALFRRALTIVLNKLGSDHPDAALCHNSIAAALQDLHRYDEALVHARKSLTINVATHGAEHQRVAENRTNIGMLLAGKKSYADAIAELQGAVAIYDKVALGTPRAAQALLQLGRTHRKAGRPRDALAPLERALALQNKTQTDRLELGVTRFELARALWRAKLDRKRAKHLAGLAYADMLSAGERGKLRATETRTWLAERKLPLPPVPAEKPR